MTETNDVFVKNEITFSFNIAKTSNEGEDADPILFTKDKQHFLSVCDGMGGAGSTTYDIDGTQKSGAYLSSRIVNKRAEVFFSDLINKGENFNENNLAELRAVFLTSLQKELSKVKKEGESKLKSKLLKDLPTTFSAMLITQIESNVDICSVWAGDSRNYLLTETEGLQQLSVDDLRQKFDPLENLTKDSPLDNVVSADGDFKIRYKKITKASPCVLFTATDGCYGYFYTPMQFEYAILQAIRNSNNVDEWKEKLIAQIESVAGDDYSMSLVAIGYQNFNEIKSRFTQRFENVYMQCVMDLQKKDEMMSNLSTEKKIIEEDIKQVDLERGELQKKTWNDYKKQYLKLIE